MQNVLAGHTLAPDRRKLLGLDGVRGIAVLAVMLGHFQRYVPALPATIPFKQVALYGWWGVDLFFALSGFLITGLLLSTRASSNYFSSFYARRTLRIFPIYYATLAVVFVAAASMHGIDRVPAPAERPLYFLYLTNWIALFKGSWPPNVLGHFWSLAVEEQFYLVWPVLVLLLSLRTLRATALVLAVLALMLRVGWVVLYGPNDAVMLVTFTRMDDLALGALCAIVFAQRDTAAGLRLEWLAAAPLAAYAIVLAVLPDESARMVFYQTIGLSLLGIGFSALILRLAFADGRNDALQRVFESGPLRRVGRYSYGMYVYHLPVLGACEILIFDRLPAPLRASVPFTLAYVVGLAIVTFGIAMASYELVEKRILDLKRFFRPAYARAGPAASPDRSAPAAPPRASAG